MGNDPDSDAELSQQLDEKCQASWHRLQCREQFIADLVDGRASVDETVARFQCLDNDNGRTAAETRRRVLELMTARRGELHRQSGMDESYAFCW